MLWVVVVWCLLMVAVCYLSLLVARCAVRAAWRALSARGVCCLLFVVRCVLFAVAFVICCWYELFVVC